MLKIRIQTNADFTPAGKRSAKIIQASRSQQLRWYVAGRIFRKLAPTTANIEMTQEWLGA